MTSSHNPPSRSCSECTHTMVCHLRITLAREINRFMLLAEPEDHAAGTPGNTNDLFASLAACCTAYTPKAPCP